MAENTLVSRLRHAWNAFMNKDPTPKNMYPYMNGIYGRPDRIRPSRRIDKTIVNAIYNRISVDVSQIEVHHVKCDKEGQFTDYADSTLEECLTIEANIDQTPRELLQDYALSLMTEGHVALVPVDTNIDPNDTESYQVLTIRVGKVVKWYPTMVDVEVYNERVGERQTITLSKSFVVIVENPFYAVMNEPSGILQRLIRKLNLLDSIDEQSGSGKLDMIIQLPYVIKTPAMKQRAEERISFIEKQLKDSPYGIAYADGTEKIVQLNRAVENNLLSQIEYLTSLAFSQLGLTEAILNGTANEEEMTNYYSRTVEPIVAALCDNMKRKWLTKTARTQGQSIMFFRDPFKLISVSAIASFADTFTRNEIMTSNEVRQKIGLKPNNDPKADQLINSNLNHSPEEMNEGSVKDNETPEKENQNEAN